MELRQLEYFVAVTDEGGFTKAAAALHVAQPGVSAQIRQLERELGQPLFDRSARQVRLTEVGVAVLPYARAALSAVEGAKLIVDEITGLLRGHVVMGAVALPSALDLPGMLADFHDRHPAVEISLVEADPVNVIEGLQAGRLDLGFFGLGSVMPAGLRGQVVVDTPLVAAVSRDDELAGKSSIALDELRDRVLICLPAGTGLRSCLEDAAATAGFRPHVAFEASEPVVLGRLAARGLGVAVLPDSAARLDDRLHVLEITRPRLRGRMVLAWRDGGGRSPAARALIEHARDRLPGRS